MNSRLTPSDPFPEDLTPLAMSEVESLNSKIQREMAHEYVHDGELDPETGQRSEELIEELDRRDEADAARPAPGTSAAATDAAAQL
ncbi:hypothetical protein ACX80H_07470 [Arthrobacter sp. MDT2-2]|jgi:hypothetical protein